MSPRPTLPRYHVGESMRCPACGGRHWIVGRSSASCASVKKETEGEEPERCDYVIELAGHIEGISSPIVWKREEEAGDAD